LNSSDHHSDRQTHAQRYANFDDLHVCNRFFTQIQIMKLTYEVQIPPRQASSTDFYISFHSIPSFSKPRTNLPAFQTTVTLPTWLKLLKHLPSTMARSRNYRHNVVFNGNHWGGGRRCRGTIDCGRRARCKD
jgi:hypothetical protein